MDQQKYEYTRIVVKGAWRKYSRFVFELRIRVKNTLNNSNLKSHRLLSIVILGPIHLDGRLMSVELCIWRKRCQLDS